MSYERVRRKRPSAYGRRVHRTTRMATVVIAVAVILAVACDSADSRTTARVDRIRGDRVCLVPEDPEQTDLEGCFPARPGDAQLLTPRACISVIIPDQLDEGSPDEPLRSIHVLNRACHR